MFEEPRGLPPYRIHDYKIILKEGIKPINVRPYRYTIVQKDVIEKLVQEMLDSEVIQPSTSSVSSPVVLVKKKKITLGGCV